MPLSRARAPPHQRLGWSHPMAESSPRPPLEPPARERSATKRFFLFSAGGTSEVLDECPHSEERLIAGLGSLVIVTTLLAFASMFVLAVVGLHLPARAALPKIGRAHV